MVNEYTGVDDQAHISADEAAKRAVRKAAVRVMIGELCRALVETVKETGFHGAPSGPMYAAFMTVGIRLDQYQAMVNVLIEKGYLRRQGDLLFWLKDFGGSK